MPTSGSAGRLPAGSSNPPSAVEERLDPALFIDRELSLLRFQQRVLEEAKDDRNPLLDRVRFLAIVGTNLDDFVMVRGPRLRTDPARRVVVEGIVNQIFRDAHLYWHRRLVPLLRANGIHLLEYHELDAEQRTEAVRHFEQAVRLQLSPLVWTPGQPLPHIGSLGWNLLIHAREANGGERFAIVRLPDAHAPLVPLRPPRPTIGAAGVPARAYAWLDQVVRANVARWFPGFQVVSAHPFRLLREASATVDSAAAGDPLANALDVVRRRDTGPVVALVAERRMPDALLQLLAWELDVPPAAVHRVRHVEGIRRKWEVSRIGRHDLHHPDIVPQAAGRRRVGSDLFAAVRKGDLLLHHPFEAFDPVVDFIRQAAGDADVAGIAMTLYRTDRESPVAHALLEAAQHGKHVRVVVELAARFDEERNVSWARRLKDAGADVSYAPPGLKVHAKLALVERHEEAGIRRYAHLSSGNYNAFTARVYTDIGLLTSDDHLTADVAQLFDALTGRPASGTFRRLIVAPVALRRALDALVEREIDHVRRGEPGHLILKMNALSDRDIGMLLYRASRAGVRVDLLVRGICCLRPGLPGTSDHIRVRSVVGRFLEHSRLWWFRNGGCEEAYVGSADLMPRNLNRRVEVMAPLSDGNLIRRVRDEILASYLADNVKARELRADGSYTRVVPRPGEAPVDAQALLLRSSPGALLIPGCIEADASVRIRCSELIRTGDDLAGW